MRETAGIGRGIKNCLMGFGDCLGILLENQNIGSACALRQDEIAFAGHQR